MYAAQPSHSAYREGCADLGPAVDTWEQQGGLTPAAAYKHKAKARCGCLDNMMTRSDGWMELSLAGSGGAGTAQEELES